MKKMVDGKVLDMSADEILRRESEDAAFEESKANPPPPPRDPRVEIDDLKAAIAALIKKGALSPSEIEAEKAAATAKAEA